MWSIKQSAGFVAGGNVECQAVCRCCRRKCGVSSSLQVLWQEEMWGVKQSAVLCQKEMWGVKQSAGVVAGGNVGCQAVCRCCGRRKCGMSSSLQVL